MSLRKSIDLVPYAGYNLITFPDKAQAMEKIRPIAKLLARAA